jgi:hypothetical protein
VDETRDGVLQLRGAGAAFPTVLEMLLNRGTRSGGEFTIEEEEDVFIGKMRVLAKKKITCSPHGSAA